MRARSDNDTRLEIEVHPATVDRFPDVAAVLAPRSSDSTACWCLAYRLRPGELATMRPGELPERLRQLCEADVAPGVIGYAAGVPVGWCSFGLRTGIDLLQRSKTIQRVDDQPVWSLICFSVRAGYRRRGVAGQLLEGAAAYVRSHGGEILEAYPLETEGARITGARAYAGTVAQLAAAGFVKVEPTTSRIGGMTRWIMRRDLTRPPG